MGAFSFRTQVREIAEDVLKLTNPIDIPVVFALSSNLPQLYFDKVAACEPYSVVRRTI